MTTYQMLNEELKYISLLYDNNDFSNAKLIEFCGMLRLAIKRELITYEEWQEMFNKVILLKGG